MLEANANGILLFNKWDASEVEVKDISLTDYIQVRNAVLLPHTAGRYATKQFRKAQMPIVERLVNRSVEPPSHRREPGPERSGWTSNETQAREAARV